MVLNMDMLVFIDNIGYPTVRYFIAILAVFLVFTLIRTRSLSYVICAAVFGVYILFVLDVAIFTIDISGNFADHMRTFPFMSRVNLIPFNLKVASDFGSLLQHLALNVALLVPFGFGISFLVDVVKGKKVLWLALVVGSSIEVIQLVISLMLGYPYRVIDINDMLMNTLGFLVGYGMFIAFSRLYIIATKRLNIEHIGLGRYVYGVTTRATRQEDAENLKLEAN